MQEQDWLTPQEFADKFRLKEPTVRSWLRRDTLRGIRIGFTWRISREVAEEYERRGKKKAG